jgi:GNAT superfamily N-acetyltransferase
MNPVVHLRRQLFDPPAAINIAGIDVRHLVVPNDVEVWLALRQRAIASLMPQPRPWLHADYQAEMFDKPWWNATHNWLATPSDQRAPDPRAGASSPPAIGAVTLAARKETAVVHWLLVDPAWRRRGIARLLISHLEVALETHSGWTAAVAFYQSMGYERVPCSRKA